MWPTPRATNRMAYYEKPSPSMIKGTHGWSLNAAVTDSHSEKPHKMWPTPNEVKKPTKGLALNPVWVEWLMGYPEGWTDLKD